jgi:hypothetical protein
MPTNTVAPYMLVSNSFEGLQIGDGADATAAPRQQPAGSNKVLLPRRAVTIAATEKAPPTNQTNEKQLKSGK